MSTSSHGPELMSKFFPNPIHLPYNRAPVGSISN